MRRIVLALMLISLVTLELAPVLAVAEERIEIAQTKKRKTLMDLLFGPKEEEPRREQQGGDDPPKKRTPRKPQAEQPEAQAPPAKPAVVKAPGATRLAVFGDSMAVDLGKALVRFYADDPNLVVVPMGVGSSGFVRQDFFDWNAEIGKQITANSFDIAVVIVGINDRQPIDFEGKTQKPLTEDWTNVYRSRVNSFVGQLRTAGKPTIWVGLPPVQGASYSKALSQISAIQRLASFAAGAEFLDIYERFADEEGKYTSFGPDVNGQRVRMRKDDGIHFSTAGADKLAFYLNQSIKLFYRGGGVVGIEVADPLLGTDAQAMVRPPYQGLGQIRLLEVAGAVVSLTRGPVRAQELVTAASTAGNPGFELSQLMEAPAGRVDAFGVAPSAEAAHPWMRPAAAQ